MPLKLSIGLSKKIGQPNYGSLGASCHVEVELDNTLLHTNLEVFHHHVKSAFTACRQAVHDELRRAQDARRSGSGDANQHDSNGKGENGHPADGPRASQKQHDYAQQIAGEIEGLGVRRLENLAHTMFAKPLADLSSLDASRLIKALKEIKAGKIDIGTALAEDPQ